MVLGCVAWLCGTVVAAEPTSNVHFSVIRDYNGKPVRNASVVLHPVDKKGKQERSGLQLKTDAEGNTNFDGVPYGPLRIQVLAPGFQTYGEDFDISKPETQITVKLKRPQGQYSVYDSHPQAGTGKGTASPSDPKPEAKPDAQEATKSEAKNDNKPETSADSPKSEKPKP
jgi:Carboxypeptidase regulatory-like domain